MALKERQLNVRLTPASDQWLEQVAGGKAGKAEYVRSLVERERRRQQEEDELAMFNEAARDLTAEDRQEREQLVSAFANREDPE